MLKIISFFISKRNKEEFSLLEEVLRSGKVELRFDKEEFALSYRVFRISESFTVRASTIQECLVTAMKLINKLK